MLKHNKAQTSIEFLMILLFLILIAVTVTIVINSTQDINVSMYKIKNRTLEYISMYDDPFIINTLIYSHTQTSLNIVVYLEAVNSSCPLEPPAVDTYYFDEYYTYSTLKSYLSQRTKFDNVSIEIECFKKMSD